MRDEPEPPRKVFQLKPRDFAAVNAPTSSAAPDAMPTDVQGHFDAANARPATTPPPPDAPPRLNDVQVLLRDEAARRKAAGLDELAPQPRRRSRRTRDYWLLLTVLNGFFALVAFGPFRNPMTLVYGVAGIIVTTIGLTWVMWFVMDDY